MILVCPSIANPQNVNLVTVTLTFVGVYLHVLADTLGSVGVIISSFFVSNYGWNVADPICSVFIACAIAYSAMPLLVDTLRLLTLRAPGPLESANPVWMVKKVRSVISSFSIYC